MREFVCRCPRVLSLDPAADLAPRLELLQAVGVAGEAARRLLFIDGALLTSVSISLMLSS